MSAREYTCNHLLGFTLHRAQNGYEATASRIVASVVFWTQASRLGKQD